jgi:hypothetical protein
VRQPHPQRVRRGWCGPAQAAVPSATAPLLHLLLLVPLLVAACGGGKEAAGGAGGAGKGAAAPAHQLVVFVFDRSGSIADYKLELARQLTNQRIEELTFGDRIAALELLQLSLSEPPRRWSQPVPDAEFPGQRMERDSLSRVRFLKDAEDYLRAFSDTAGRGSIAATDILSTLHDVAAEVRAWPGYRSTIYLFSDMMQANRQVNMETGPIPGPGWVRREAAAGKLPDLGGACVMVIGARTDTDLSQRVKAFWDAYFKATNAVLLDRNYTLRPVRLPEHPCGGAGGQN